MANVSGSYSDPAVMWTMTSEHKTLKRVMLNCSCGTRSLIARVDAVVVTGSNGERAYWPDGAHRCPDCGAQVGAFQVGG